MSEAKRRKYTEEFKTEAVRLLREADKPIAQVARELGINPNLLSRWRPQNQFPPRFIAITDNAIITRQIADTLNDIDKKARR